MGHEGPGSLLSYLKARGWATDLMAGVLESTSGFALFGVDVRVTEQVGGVGDTYRQRLARASCARVWRVAVCVRHVSTRMRQVARR